MKRIDPESARNRGTLSPRVRLGAVVLTATALAALASGCAAFRPATNNSRYYFLTSTRPLAAADEPTNEAPRVDIRIRPVELAEYLNTKDIVLRTGTNEVDYALFHRWAEPLDAGIRRVLVEDLRMSPAVREVLTDQPSAGRHRVYTLSVQVLACSGKQTDGHGSIEFTANWQLTTSGAPNTVLDHGVFRAHPTGWNIGDYGQLAAELSQALGDFSQVVLEAIPGPGSARGPRASFGGSPKP